MSIIEKLASSLGHRDEEPNIELAQKIAAANNTQSIPELILLLSHKDKAIQNDSIKVIYEVGMLKPKLISDHWNTFIDYLKSKNNRLQWGAMTALGCIVKQKPENIYNALDAILGAADKGTVITKDYAMNILIELCTLSKYKQGAFQLMIEQLLKSAPNQLPMYAERAMVVINHNNKMLFIKTLQSRLVDIEKESKRKRVEKVIKKLG